MPQGAGSNCSVFVSPEWLQKRLAAGDVTVLDVRGKVESAPATAEDGSSEATPLERSRYVACYDDYLAGHVPVRCLRVCSAHVLRFVGMYMRVRHTPESRLPFADAVVNGSVATQSQRVPAVVVSVLAGTMPCIARCEHALE